MDAQRLKKIAYGLTVWFISVVICFNLAGCKESKIDLTRYKCSQEQLKLVEEETAICSKTGYLSSHCFAQAKKTHCTEIGNSVSR